MKKLLLINPVNNARVGLSVNKSSRFPPLGLGIIAALTPGDWEVLIADENFEPFRYKEADLVGITAFTASAPRAYEICGMFSGKGIPVVMGGIHASMNPEEALEYADTVVKGEAEGVWERIISDFEAGQMHRLYDGGRAELGRRVIPRHDLFDKRYMFGSIQTARGCPMNCDFCSVTAFNGNTYRQRPVEHVLDELELVPRKMVFFVDDNIIGYGQKARERALELFRGIIDRKIKKQWFCQASINFADDDEVLYYAAKSGCRMVFLGLEAESDGALKDVSKNLNLKIGVKGYEEIFRRINRRKIAVLGAFIYGLDTDSIESLERRTRYMINSGVDVIQTTILTPLPGTRLFKRMFDEKRLLRTSFPQDWGWYDMTEAVYSPRNFSAEELNSYMSESDKKIAECIWRKFFKTLTATGSFITAMWALSSNMNYRKVAAKETRMRAMKKSG